LFYRSAMTDTKRRILDASILMIAEGGVRAVSFREVARRAGVSHQAPYHHFPNHEAILREIAREGFAALADAMEQAGTAGADPVDGLVGAGRAYLAFALEHVGHYRVMFQRPIDPEPLPEAERTLGVLASLTEAVVVDGGGGGASPEVLARLCWSTVHGLASLAIEGALDVDVDDGAVVVEALGRLLRR
jgi:AcrR family transcriptional regulator